MAWRTELQKSLFFPQWNLQPLQISNKQGVYYCVSGYQRRINIWALKTDPHILKGNKHLGGWRGKTLHVLPELEDRRAAALAEVLKWFAASKVNITKKWMNNWNKQSESIDIHNSKGWVYQPSYQEQTTDLLPYWVWVAIRKTNKGTFYQSFS